MIIDEALDVVTSFNDVQTVENTPKQKVTPSDIMLLLENEIIKIEKDNRVVWLDKEYAEDCKFSEVQRFAKLGRLYCVDQQFLVAIFPPEMFECFDEIYILTYMFGGSTFKYYLGFILSLVSMLTTAISFLNDKRDDEIQKAKEAAQAYEQEINSLENLRQEYLDIVDSNETEAKKNEQLIEWKKKLVKAYKTEEDAINGVTIARETGLAVIDKEQYYNALDFLEQNEELYAKAKKAMEHNSFVYSADDFGAGKKAVDKYKDKLKELGLDVSVENRGWQSYVTLDLNTKSAEETKRKLLDALDYFKELTGREAEDIVGVLENSYNIVDEKIKTYSDIYNKGYFAEATKEFYKFTQTAEGALSQVTDVDSFQKWKNKVLEMAGDSEPLKNALKELADERFPEYAKAVDDTSDKSNNAKSSLTDLTKVIIELGEKMEDFIGTADKFGEAIGKAISGQDFDFSEIFELIQLVPKLADKFEKVAGGKFKIAPEILFDAAVEYGKGNNPITNLLETSKKNIENIQQQLEEIESAGVTGGAYAQAKSGLEQKLKQEQNSYKVLENLLETYGDVLNGTLFDEALEGIKDKIDDHNDKIEKVQDAIEKMNEGAALTYEELIKLEELFPKVSQSATEGVDGYYLQIDVLNELMNTSYEERDAFIQNQIDKTQALIEQTKQQIEAKETLYNTLQNIENKFGNGEKTADMQKTQDEIDELNATIEKYEDTVSLLNAMLGKLYKSSSKQAKEESKKLQDKIDYYDTLIKAIDAVTDKEIKALEDKKDALKKLKDALKDANDEQQRELDLINARNGLQNAEKRKVYVYTDGYGFQQTQDKKAVKEAEEKLRDVELDIQEANIDKEIDKLDEQIDAFEDYKKQFTDMKSDIEDLIAIEKAKNALDLDEQGLLNLPPETAKEIQEGLAEAVLKKDKEDNKDNKEYDKFGDVAFDDFLKKLGTPLSSDEIYKKWTETMLSSFTSPPELLRSVAENISNSSEVYNNNKKEITFAPNINVYGVSNKQEIADAVEEKVTDIFRQFRDSVI